MLIVDEIYHRLVYDRPATTALAVGEDVIVVNSFSKFFQMTGFRLGWLVAPPALVAGIDRLAQNLFLAPSTVAQYAALAGFDEQVATLLESRRKLLHARRDFLVAGLRKLGFIIPKLPDGAFYVYADCSAHTQDSLAFAQGLLEDHGVAITPGVDFDTRHGATHLRFAYTTDIEGMAEALDRTASFIAR